MGGKTALPYVGNIMWSHILVLFAHYVCLLFYNKGRHMITALSSLHQVVAPPKAASQVLR